MDSETRGRIKGLEARMGAVERELARMKTIRKKGKGKKTAAEKALDFFGAQGDSDVFG